MRKPSWIITDNTIVVNYDGKPHMLSKTDAYAPKLIEAIKEGRWEEVPMLISAASRIETFSKGLFTVKDEQVYVDGELVPEVLGKKIKDFSDEGLPYEPLVNFWKNLKKNPSYRAVNELYMFLERNNHPITEDGCFIAYKKVRTDFLDCHTGTIDNSVGKVVSMPRNQVNEDCNQTCSFGLHAANYQYARDFQTGIMLEVKINPMNVVSIPVDYNFAKMRVCEYEVLSVVEEELKTTTLRWENTNYSDNPEKESNEEEDDPFEYLECSECWVENEDVKYNFDYLVNLCPDCEEDYYDEELEGDY